MTDDINETYNKAYQAIKNNNLPYAKNEFEDMRTKLKTPNEAIINNCTRWLGIINMELVKYESAEKLFSGLMEKLSQGEKFDISLESSLGTNSNETQESLTALTYHDLGFTQICLKKYSEAEDNIKKAIEYIDNNKLKRDMKAWFLNDLGLCYFEWGKFDQAIEQYDKVIKLELKDTTLNAYPHFYRGLALFGKGDLIRAKESLLYAKKQFDEAKKQFEGKKEIDQLKLVIASILINICRIDLKNEDYVHVKDELDKAKNIYNEPSVINYINTLTKRNQDKEEMNKEALKILQGVYYYESDDEDYKNAEKELNGVDSAKAYNILGCIYYKWRNKGKDKTDICEKFDKIANRIMGEGEIEADNIPEDYLERAKYFFSKAKRKASEEDNNDEYTRITAEKNLKIASQEKSKTESSDWWSWWTSSWVKSALCSILVVLLIISLGMGLFYIPLCINPGDSEETTIVTINNTALPLVTNSSEIINTTEVPKETNNVNGSQETAGAPDNGVRVSSIINTTTIETSYPLTTTTQKTTKKNTISPETILLFSAFIFVILIHPLVKSFSAGAVKLDLKDEPKITTSGASASTGADVRT